MSPGCEAGQAHIAWILAKHSPQSFALFFGPVIFMDS